MCVFNTNRPSQDSTTTKKLLVGVFLSKLFESFAVFSFSFAPCVSSLISVLCVISDVSFPQMD